MVQFDWESEDRCFLLMYWTLQLSAMSLLLTVWDSGIELSSDLFLGEVLLDLASADVRGSLVWYDLQEHDLTCSKPLAPVQQHDEKKNSNVLSSL